MSSAQFNPRFSVPSEMSSKHRQTWEISDQHPFIMNSPIEFIVFGLDISDINIDTLAPTSQNLEAWNMFDAFLVLSQAGLSNLDDQSHRIILSH